MFVSIVRVVVDATVIGNVVVVVVVVIEQAVVIVGVFGDVNVFVIIS